MTTLKQKLVLGGLASASGLIWAPQIMGMLEPESKQSAPVDGAVEAAFLPMGAVAEGQGSGFAGPAGGFAGQPMGMDTGASGGEGSFAVSTAGIEGTDELIESLISALDRAEPLSGGPALTEMQVSTGTTPSVMAGQSQPEPEPESSDAPSDPLSEFLEAHAFQGTIVSATSAHALFGAYLVPEGAKLPGTSLVLASVERHSARVQGEGLDEEVALPPLRATGISNVRRRSLETDEPTEGEDESDASEDPQSTTPDVFEIDENAPLMSPSEVSNG